MKKRGALTICNWRLPIHSLGLVSSERYTRPFSLKSAWARLSRPLYYLITLNRLEDMTSCIIGGTLTHFNAKLPIVDREKISEYFLE